MLAEREGLPAGRSTLGRLLEQQGLRQSKKGRKQCVFRHREHMTAYGNMTQPELAQRLAGLEDLRVSLGVRLTAALEAPPPPTEVSAINAYRALVLLTDGTEASIAKPNLLRRLIEHITPWPDKSGITIYAAR